MDRLGKPSAYSCPECSGVLWEVNDPAAARSLEESASFARRLSDRCRTSDLQDAAAQYQLRAENDEAHAASIVAMLTRMEDRAPSDEH